LESVADFLWTWRPAENDSHYKSYRVFAVLVAVLVLVLGVTVTAYVAIGVAVLAIVLGCVDYVRSPNRRRHG
jgi:Flp pilus assembly protein TadB